MQLNLSILIESKFLYGEAAQSGLDETEKQK